MSEWFHCDYCNGPADIEGICPRCRQLADLEREIGRAAIGLRIIEGMQDHEDNKPRTDDNFKAILFLEDWFTKCDFDLDPLITRWRKLHAAGAEAATGGEEAK